MGNYIFSTAALVDAVTTDSRDHRSAHDIGSAEWELQAEREPTACGSSGDKKGAASHLGNVAHDRLPHALAAVWIAARTC